MKQDVKATLKARIAKGLNFGIEAVEEVLDPASALYDEYILLKSKYNDLMYISTLNTLPYEQIEIGLDRLRSNLIKLIGKLDSNSLKKEEVARDLKVDNLPTRRTNFFKLLDIHFNNLQAVEYVEIYGQAERRKEGREAVFEIYQMHRRSLRSKDEKKDFKAIQSHFRDYFEGESGILEVYLKNIKHLMAYALASEIEQQFFINTLKSLFSRYELALLLYYALSDIDPEFRSLVRKSSMIDPSISDILIDATHIDLLEQEP